MKTSPRYVVPMVAAALALMVSACGSDDVVDENDGTISVEVPDVTAPDVTAPDVSVPDVDVSVDAPDVSVGS